MAAALAPTPTTMAAVPAAISGVKRVATAKKIDNSVVKKQKADVSTEVCSAGTNGYGSFSMPDALIYYGFSTNKQQSRRNSDKKTVAASFLLNSFL